MKINSERLMNTLETMWQIGATPNGGVTRLALSDDDKRGRDQLRRWFEEAGLDVRVDDFGNMVGRRAGTQDLPPVIIGSHADTVPQGGRYDGILGVLGGLEVVRALNDVNIETERPIEIINWTAEEGSRFSPPLFGSSAALGDLDAEVAWDTRDADGIRFGDELARIGYDGDIANRPTQASYYLELHIEQGPVLEAEEFAVGLVQGIIAQSWHRVTIHGRAGHAGSTPVHLRSDALVAAAEIILEARNLALDAEEHAVSTVGIIKASPGAQNVIPDNVQFSVDLRAADPEYLTTMESGIAAAGRLAEARHGVRVESSEIGRAPRTAFDTKVMTAIRDAMLAEHLPVKELWSGPGHDAQPASLRWPTGMIFVRSKDGLSHAEAEYSSPEDIAAGVAVLLRAATELAGTNDG